MTTTLFLQDEVQNPYKLYETMLREHPVYWDDVHNLWAIYSFADCTAILSNPSAYIPAGDYSNKSGLNEYASLITRHLARLSNRVQHQIARHIAMLLIDNMKAIAINDLIENLLNGKHETDWVDSICKKLPLTVVLKCFDFNENNTNFIVSKIEPLTKIMLPNKTPEQIAAINEISKEIYTITENHLLTTNFHKVFLKPLAEKYKATPAEITSLCISNLIGLFIQSYDAGRGLLSNSLLQIIHNRNSLATNFTDKSFFEKCVVETLRFDPPVHNTRRVAADDIMLHNIQIKKGQVIFIILAAANRDPLKFKDPHLYDIERANNADHITFGAGGHRCPANLWSGRLATETLAFIFGKYQIVQLVEKDICYEPLINARLPKNIFIFLS